MNIQRLSPILLVILLGLMALACRIAAPGPSASDQERATATYTSEADQDDSAETGELDAGEDGSEDMDLVTVEVPTLAPTAAPTAIPTLAPTTASVLPSDNTVDAAACNAFLGTYFVEEEAYGGDEAWDDEGYDETDSEEDNEIVLVTYQVDGDQITAPVKASVSGDLLALQKDTQTQREIWDYFVHFMPAEQRKLIGEFIIFTDGVDNVLAAVDQISVTPEVWTLEIDIADTGNQVDLTYSLLHEYGHILTLNNTQFTDETRCSTYASDEICSTEESYLNQFYQQFWTDIYDEWEVAYDEDTLDAFYDAYADQFVNDYAATHPDEDIVESWQYFVTFDRPTGDSIADQKVLFFYDFPELVSLRDEIRNNLCAYLIEP